MRRFSRAILNCGAAAAAAADGGAFPNPNRRTPDHPPYSEMVSVALQALAEENGSTESSISAYIQSAFNDLPWGHDRLLPYYLRKLVADGELTSPSPGRYQLPFHSPPSVSLPIRRRGRPRLFHPKPNPNDSHLPSAPPRRRGRPPKVHAEDTPPLHPEQETPPLKRGRGRSRLQRGASVGRTRTRRLGLRLPSSRGSKRRKDSIPVSNIELNCQSGNSVFFNDIKNVGSDYAVLDDPENIELGHVLLEQGQPFVTPEQSDVSKGQFLGEEPPLVPLEPGTMPPFLAPEHYELVEGQPLLGEKPPCLAPEQAESSQDQSMLGEKLPLLTPEEGKALPFLASKFFGDDHVQSMQEAAPPFMPPEQTEPVQLQFSLSERLPFFTHKSGKMQPFLAPEFSKHDHGQGGTPPIVTPEQTVQVPSSPRERRPPITTLEPGKVSPFLAPEFLEHDQGQASQGEEPSFMSPEQTERVQKQSIQGLPFITSEEHEQDDGIPLATSEESEDEHDQRLVGIGTADPMGEELVLMPLPDEEEVENAPVSSRKRKSHGKRRSLKLWFES